MTSLRAPATSLGVPRITVEQPGKNNIFFENAAGTPENHSYYFISKINFSHWQPMGANGSQWEPMGANGSQWEPMGANESQWEPMGTFGNQWEPMGVSDSCRTRTPGWSNPSVSWTDVVAFGYTREHLGAPTTSLWAHWITVEQSGKASSSLGTLLVRLEIIATSWLFNNF